MFSALAILVVASLARVLGTVPFNTTSKYFLENCDLSQNAVYPSFNRCVETYDPNLDNSHMSIACGVVFDGAIKSFVPAWNSENQEDIDSSRKKYTEVLSSVAGDNGPKVRIVQVLDSSQKTLSTKVCMLRPDGDAFLPCQFFRLDQEGELNMIWEFPDSH